MVVLSMAWRRHEIEERHPSEPDMEAVTSWVERLLPLIQAEHKKEVIVVLANRCGMESAVQYAGTSTVLGIKEGKIQVYGMLGRDEESLLVVDTNEPPKTNLGLLIDNGTPISDSPMLECQSASIDGLD